MTWGMYKYFIDKSISTDAAASARPYLLMNQ